MTLIEGVEEEAVDVVVGGEEEEAAVVVVVGEDAVEVEEEIIKEEGEEEDEEIIVVEVEEEKEEAVEVEVGEVDVAMRIKKDKKDEKIVWNFVHCSFSGIKKLFTVRILEFKRRGSEFIPPCKKITRGCFLFLLKFSGNLNT